MHVHVYICMYVYHTKHHVCIRFTFIHTTFFMGLKQAVNLLTGVHAFSQSVVSKVLFAHVCNNGISTAIFHQLVKLFFPFQLCMHSLRQTMMRVEKEMFFSAGICVSREKKRCKCASPLSHRINVDGSEYFSHDNFKAQRATVIVITSLVLCSSLSFDCSSPMRSRSSLMMESFVSISLLNTPTPTSGSSQPSSSGRPSTSMAASGRTALR
jgi:hypothetical protein